MDIARKFALGVCETIMFLCIGLFIFGLIFRITIGNSVFIEKTISGSGIYTVVTNNLKNQIQGSNSFSSSENPIITSAINKAFSVNRIQDFAESGISQTYAWLEGETQTPKFSLDTNQIKIDMADAIANGLSERAATLPACSSRIRPTTNDIFTINCIPPGTDINVEIFKIKQQILTADTNQLGQNTPISAESITFSSNQQPYYKNLAQLPKYYQLLKNLVFILTMMFLIMAVVVIILKKPRYKALKTLALPFMIYGILYIIAGFIVPSQLNKLIDANIKSINPPEFIAPLKFIATSMIKQGSGALTKTGIIFFVIGLACLIIYILIKRKTTPVLNPPTYQTTSQSPDSM